MVSTFQKICSSCWAMPHRSQTKNLQFQSKIDNFDLHIYWHLCWIFVKESRVICSEVYVRWDGRLEEKTFREEAFREK